MNEKKCSKPDKNDKRSHLLYTTLVNVNNQLIKKIQELSIVHRVNDSLHYLPDMQDVCCSIIDTIRDEINVQYCSIMVLDNEKQCLKLKALWSPKKNKAIFYKTDSPHHRFKLDEGVAGRVAKEGKSILISDVTVDDRFVAIQKNNSDIKSLLCMPLKVGDEIVGVLNLSHNDPNAFGNDEQHMLKMITNQIAVALKNVHLFSEMKNLNHTLEKRVKERTKRLEDINSMLITTRDQLVHSEKMAALGTLAGGVAHEFNNLLCMIQGYSELALQKDDVETCKRALSVVLSACQRAKNISKNLLSFSKRTESKKELCCLQSAMEETLIIIEKDIEKDNIKVIRKYEEVPNIVCDISLIQQVFLNLIINARHAMSETKGGTLTIRIYHDDKYAVVAISDTGHGIKKELGERIFEPFFTTKGVWGNGSLPGTGLGLSVSLGVIESHNGIMEIDGSYNKGARFLIKLPLIAEMATKTVDGNNENFDTEDIKGLKILVVDDEDAIRELLGEMLRIAGHSVKVVNDAAKALKECEKQDFDVVFLDIMMPGIDGVTCASRIKVKSGKPRMVFITGLNVEQEIPNSKYDISSCEYIKKPFNFSEIKKVLKKISSEPALFYNI
ncbi:response regulator [bacterium]|nr:response regulator [bacterium]